MAKAANTEKQQLTGIVEHLRFQRESILNKWRTVCYEDPLTNSNGKSSFSREEFNDQIPVILNILNQRLAGLPEEADLIHMAQEHGLHRWQRSYTLPELLAEFEHLFNVLLTEVKYYHQHVNPLSADTFLIIHEQVLKIAQEANKGSVLYYDELRQTNAAEQASAMHQALEHLEELGKRRNSHLRESTHDLRSSFSILMSTSGLLQMPETENERTLLVEVLNRNLGTIRDMLLQLSDYARLEAGQEFLEIKEFDVAELLTKIIDNTAPLAGQKNIEIRREGPVSLKIKSDSVKVQRIVQNLLLNALKYTRRGSISVSWTVENEMHWAFSIQDTGPGFSPSSPAGVLAEQLKPALQRASSHQNQPGFKLPPEEQPSPEMPKEAIASQLKESEGLGLFIVKKLCELLKATMEIESIPGKGTLIRVQFLTVHE